MAPRSVEDLVSPDKDARHDAQLRLPEEIYQDAVRLRDAAATARACLLRGHLSLAGWRTVMRDRCAATPADALAMARRIDAFDARRWEGAPRDPPRRDSK